MRPLGFFLRTTYAIRKLPQRLGGGGESVFDDGPKFDFGVLAFYLLGSIVGVVIARAIL